MKYSPLFSLGRNWPRSLLPLPALALSPSALLFLCTCCAAAWCILETQTARANDFGVKGHTCGQKNNAQRNKYEGGLVVVVRGGHKQTRQEITAVLFFPFPLHSGISLVNWNCDEYTDSAVIFELILSIIGQAILFWIIFSKLKLIYGQQPIGLRTDC